MYIWYESPPSWQLHFDAGKLSIHETNSSTIKLLLMKFEHCLIFSLSLCSSFRAASNVDLLFWMQVGKFGYLKIYRQFDTQKNVDILIPCWMRSKVDIVWFEWRLIVFEIHPKRKKREKREITLIFQINFLCIDDWGKLWMNVVLVFVYWNMWVKLFHFNVDVIVTVEISV